MFRRLLRVVEKNLPKIAKNTKPLKASSFTIQKSVSVIVHCYFSEAAEPNERKQTQSFLVKDVSDILTSVMVCL